MPKQNAEGLLPDGSLRFTIVLPAPIAKQFEEARLADERESKSEFARILIKRQLMDAAERKAFEEFKRLRQTEIPHIPGVPPPAQERQTG